MTMFRDPFMGFIPPPGSAVEVPDGWSWPGWQDRRDCCTPVDNQDHWEACQSVAVNHAIQSMDWIRIHRKEELDWLAVFQEATKEDGYDGKGAKVDTAHKVAITMGLCPYPNGEYIFNEDLVKCYIHSYGGVILVYKMTDAWPETGRSGIIPNSTKYVGVHAVWGCWYEENFGMGHQGSWGTNVGANGFFKMPWDMHRRDFQYAYVIHNRLVKDAETVTKGRV